MKKLLVVFMAVLLTVGLAGAVLAADTVENPFDKKFATAKTATVEGTVLSHDVKCHCIVIKGASGNVVVQDDYAKFNQEYNKVKGLKLNAAAKITYKTVDSINYATEVEQK